MGPSSLKDIFASALKKLPKPNQVPNRKIIGPAPSLKPQQRVFYHMEFHPNDIPRHLVRKIYSDECRSIFKAEMGIEQFTMAYSRPKTIGNIITKGKLFEVNGREVSKFITGEQN